MDTNVEREKTKRRAKLLQLAALGFCALLLASVAMMILGVVKSEDEILVAALMPVGIGVAGVICSVGRWDREKKRHEIMEDIGRKKNPNRRPMDQLMMAYASGALAAMVRRLPIQNPRLYAEMINKRGSIFVEGKRNQRLIEMHFEDTQLVMVDDGDEDNQCVVRYKEVAEEMDQKTDFVEALFERIAETLNKS